MFEVYSVHSLVLELCLGKKRLNVTSVVLRMWYVLEQSICNVVLQFLHTRLQILDNPRFLEKLLL